MFSVFVAFSFIALAQAASLVPLKSSQVDVRSSGADFSYNIQESHGVAAIGDPLPTVELKTVHLEPSGIVEQVKEKPEEHQQIQIQHDQKVEARANFNLKESPKPAEPAVILQPLSTAPYYRYQIHPQFYVFPSQQLLATPNLVHLYPSYPLYTSK